MDSEKLLRFFLLIAIFVGILKCISITPQYKSAIAMSNHGNKKVDESGNKCTFTKEDAKKSIKDDKDKASEKISQCNSKCLSDSGNNLTGKGDSSGSCKSCTDLLPVMDPMYNMREMCKQIILLEDHLFQKEKRCHDCICKHFLTIEALAEEAITLDKSHKYPELGEIPTKVRAITKKYVNNHKDHSQHAVTGQDLRELRKGLMQKCFNHF
jgi:hypothetical protein